MGVKKKNRSKTEEFNRTSYDGSVAKDFTLFERSKIQEWTKKAKAKNEKEPS